jgi:REP element-mobilizing transposase RayT
MSPTKPCLNRVAPAGARSGHAALRRGRVTLHHGVYFITAATYRRIALFRDCCAARTAARSFEDPRVLGDASMLAWVLMPDHAH